MAGLIRSNIRHISDAANNADSFRVLRGHVSVLKMAPDDRLLPYLESWALYRMSFLARVSHQPYLYPLPLMWTTRPGIGKSSDVPIYRLRIEQHAWEGQVGRSDAASELDPDPTAYYSPQQAEPEKDPQPVPGQAQSNVDSHGYRPDLVVGEYYPSFAEGEYAYEFELFGSPRPQYGMPGPSNTYPQHYGTHVGSSSSAANEQHDLSSMFSTPPAADDEDVSRRPGRECRPPRRYTPRTTPSNHQFQGFRVLFV
ncbi:hypothetical protein GOBAR_DD05643 [Gossypium barbadense]|nr:hypothetical protein GOBAR_DD05643 [Gossypium barbadense]